MSTKINISVIVTGANFIYKDTNLIRVSVVANDLRREHVAG